ncbi:PREDICTED: two-pore potassium channel 2-like [Camelina sativa]|uniref:Two-pore potassium channel 2-like n=1 Tax=Camelina sativa TaxID=90675 RepID=A0ABM0X6G7_CAMSA|nr:PREDICTED: two-pore potassium channel 2-like [Camelina sativa]
MANDGNGSNSNDPLRQYLIIPRINQPPSLFPLPEEHNNDVTIPMPMTPSQFKNRLIFGSKKDSSLLVDALSQNPYSPSSSATTSFSDSLDLLIPPPEPSVLPVRKPKPAHHFHRSKTAPAMAAINDISHPHDQKTEQTDSKTIVRQAVALLVVYLSLGVLLYWLNRDSYNVNQTHPVVDALYFCIVTMCTIGYGDITPDSVVTKLFSILFVLVGFGFIDILLSGMVTYVLDLQENYMLEAARNDSLDDREKARSYIIDIKKGRMRIRLKVGLALGVVVLCVGFGVLIMHFVEEIEWFDSFYFSVMSVTTVGYGDRVFHTMSGRLLAAIWLLVSTLAVARAFLYLAEARIDKRNRERAKKVLGENMSISQFFAADIDHNGCVSKAEYVIYKLKKMEKITDKDINPIGNQFDKLDRTNSGRITLLDLLETSTDDLSTATSV